MKIGLVGYQGSGKSSLFHWLTGQPPDPALATSTQTAMATVPEPRLEQLIDIYQPKKVTRAAIQVVDTPGISRDGSDSASKLAPLREAGCLIILVSAFAGQDPSQDLASFEDDLLIADLAIVAGRVERLRESVKKPRPGRDQEIEELALLEPLLAALEAGQALRDIELTPPQEKIIRAFQLLTQKPRLLLINSDQDDSQPTSLTESLPPGTSMISCNVAMELELEEMDAEERLEFCREMEITRHDRDELLQLIMQVSGQMLFFTAGDKEVRSWIVPVGTTAVEAAGNIHTDLARGFIRAETMNADDLIRLGGERELKAENLMRREPRDYVLQVGDIILVQHN